MTKKEPLILAVDTSCDDTAAAILQGRTILSNVIASQTQLHKQYGGVFPTVAKQAHKENIAPTILAALKRAKVSWEDVDALAVTVGPGLAPALEVGITAIKELAIEKKLPLIAVNHIEGHAVSAIALRKTKITEDKSPVQKKESKINFPVLSVVVSGGHTQFIYFEEIGTYRILGTTIDDAAGECLDKIGRMLNLGYPAGPIIEKFAKLGNPKAIEFPLPMTSVKTYDMSFSGMKTFARNYIQRITEEKSLVKQAIYDFCASTQYAVFRHIIYKLNKLLEDIKISEIWLGGGVAQNVYLRQTIREAAKNHSIGKANKIIFRYPHTNKLCMDNAAMIGLVANFKFERGEFVSDFSKIDRKPRWEIGEKL
ncbi:MAG: tRNA N6-adenosine threonylcarbamoyltransferase [Patescibacteria group bacterium]|nr:MAG: tRNA N6-adenosine threonylcarbamoyltransferase [Patescibacteria group bacterium]